MPLTLLQNELRLMLSAYLAGELSLDDFRGWEVSQIGSSDRSADDEEVIGRLALIAETVVSEAAEESYFAAEARREVDRLDAECFPRVATGIQAAETRDEAVSIGFAAILANLDDPILETRDVDISPVEVTL